MFTIKSELVLIFMIINVSNCQRRIKDGQPVLVDKKYMAYFIKAPISAIAYDFWLCGGAIVSSEFVITSAACVNDVDYLYVIAGYNKYVTDDEIEVDKCTSKKKKKVIYTCSPKGYELKYGELDYWSYIDIALVKVESPFDFNDEEYVKLCSYKPTTIAINYEEKYQEAGTDALVLGWGHNDGWRKPGDTNNYNQEFIKYAPTLLLDKRTCIEHYEDYTNMSEVIKTYMICSLGKGNIDDGGDTILKSLPIENGCTTDQQKVLGFEGVSCEQKSSGESSENRRRFARKFKQMYNDSLNETFDTEFIDGVRRSGICQNDHGGPLITWSGAREILIGIASVFKVSDESECMGPYLYTSTLCTGLFLDCILTSGLETEPKANRRDLCDRPAREKGYETIERYISWKNHPAGPAANENIGRSGESKSTDPDIMKADNTKYQDETKYETNNMYFATPNPLLQGYAANEYPGYGMYQANNGNPVNEKSMVNPTNQRYPNHYNYPANGMYPGHINTPVSQGYPANGMYPGYDKYSINERNPANENYPLNVGYSANVKYWGHNRYQRIGNSPTVPDYLKIDTSNKAFVMRPQRPLRN